MQYKVQQYVYVERRCYRHQMKKEKSTKESVGIGNEEQRNNKSFG